uniref:Aminoglycoside phosphotransferase domain-containing protein n=1 Tax=Tetradesmus obliquus TaxID=3088 RepID=A0A383WLQ4_TETOB|eukprot:jgi/Sobl393_1/6324/SZX78397.1
MLFTRKATSASCRAVSRQQASRVAAKRMLVAVRDAPKTGQHSVEQDLMQEALACFFTPEQQAATAPTTGGVNNVVNYVSTADGHKYVVRIYNNGNKTEKVKTEHDILGQLSQQTLSFKVPAAKPALGSGEPYVVLSNGAAACVFEIIPGELAKTTSPEEVGRATGELCSAMAAVQLDSVPPIPPYYDVFRVHHAINRELFYQDAASNPAFEVCREAMDFLVEQIQALEPKLEAYQQLGLPMQIIHGDLHYDNVMVLGDNVSGLLDFEFCAYDWRVMELAVALSKYVGEEQPLPLITQFVAGYAQKGQLSEQEIEILPDLINLRIFSNVIYFTGRALAGEDGIDSLTSRAGSYAKRVAWVNANREAIVAAVKERMLQLATSAA